MAKTARIQIVLDEDLKAAAMEASKEKRGGLSQVIRELLEAWLSKKKPARGKPGRQ